MRSPPNSVRKVTNGLPSWISPIIAASSPPGVLCQICNASSACVSPHWPKSSPGYFADMRKKLKGFVEGGQLGIFAKGYWGHPAYKLPPEANLMAVSHYLEALSWQRDVVKLHAIFAPKIACSFWGKNPHPNFLVGGVPCSIDLNSDSAINMKRLSQVQDVINQMMVFVD